MGQATRLYKFLMSLPFWWILLTTIYVVLTFLDGGYFAGLLGLFVPIGVSNFFFSFRTFSGRGSHAWIVVFPLILVTIFCGEWFLRKWRLSPVTKILLILGILFILTVAVDFVIWGSWASLQFLKAGGEIKL